MSSPLSVVPGLVERTDGGARDKKGAGSWRVTSVNDVIVRAISSL